MMLGVGISPRVLGRRFCFMNIKVIGAASDLGVSRDGTSLGPETIRPHLSDIDYELIRPEGPITKSRDKNDLRKNEKEICAYSKVLYDAMFESKKDGNFTILTGGDHTYAISSALSSQALKKKIGVMWIDAHTDFNTFRTTETGNIHGLPLACIAGYECEELRAFHEGDTVSPANICVVGARSIDREERENLKDAGVRVFSTDEVHERGIETVMKEAFEICLNGTEGVHVSFDLDVIDPQDAPGVTVPECCGISRDEAFEINGIVASHINDLVSYDVVELNPLNDKEHKTEDIAVRLLSQVIEAAK